MKSFFTLFAAILMLNLAGINAQTPAINPDLAPSCPMNILFILDESGSINGYGSGTANVSSQVRTGAGSLLNALSGTGSRVAVVEFNTTARRASIGGTTAYQVVDASTINDFLGYINDPSGNTAAESNHYDPEDYIANPQTTFTNWQDALVMAKSMNATEGVAQLIVFFTDGNPTAYNKSTGGVTTGTTPTVTANALNIATTAANNVKAQGSHIFVIGFPNPNLSETNLQAISGTERYPDLQPDFTLGDYTVSSSQTLQQDLHSVGVVICHTDLKLIKTVSGTISCPGSNVVFTLTITNEGLLNATGVVVKDYLPAGYTYVSNNAGASYSSGTLTWNVGNLNYLQAKTLQLTATVNVSGGYQNIAEVTACTPDDGDSSPGNGNSSEDDYSAAGIITLLNCADANACTIDACANGACTHAQNPLCCSSNANCNDDNPCTADACVGSLCAFTSIVCNDDNDCTNDACNQNSGECSFTPVSCDDANSCTVDDCDIASGCTHVVGPNCCNSNAECEDNSGCTADICAQGICSNVLNCDDANSCTVDACENDLCTHNAPDCDDNNLCTNDICSEGNCAHITINCFDNNSCTLDACTDGICTHTLVVCSDANPCTNDICAGGYCRFIPKNCNDNNSCTSDACSEGACVNTPKNCNDGNACTVDLCNNGACSNTAMNCNDLNANTIDACVNGECMHTYVTCENPAPLYILFILDESGSISGFGTGTGNVSSQVRNGVSALFNSLVNTNSRIAAIEFNTTARRAVIGGTSDFRQITPANLADYTAYVSDNNLTADNNHYDPEDYTSNQSGTYTNWDAALQLAHSINADDSITPLIVFFTDGFPTAYNNSSGGVTTGSGPAFEAVALTEAVSSANQVKGQGAHIFVVGVPNPILPESNIKAVSGPNRYPDVEPVFTQADYSISTSQSLQNDLAQIGGLLCRADLSLKNTVSQPVACTGNALKFTLTLTNNGLENATGVQVKNYLPNGYNYVNNNGGALFSAGTLTWDVGNLNNGETKTLEVNVTINAAGNYKNVAEITHSDQEDNDSQPNNYNGNNPAEDDEAASTVVMNCNCYLRITSLSMMFEGQFGEVGELTDGKVINRDTLCRWNVRANLCQSPVGSVKFLINGSVFRTENTAPYSLNGDQPSGFFTPWIPNPGNYTLTAVACSGPSGSGTAGPSYTVRFTVLDGENNPGCNAPPQIDCAGKVNGTAFIDDCGICSGGTSEHLANSNKDRCGVCNGDGTSCCFTDEECSDNNLCTFDFCNTGVCEFISNIIDDGNSCTLDGCNPETGGFYQLPVNCDDANSCTADNCNPQSGCTHETAQGCCILNADCNDSNACTDNICSSSQCVFTPINCDDNVSCTTDNCSSQAGCLHEPSQDCCVSAANCNDNNACTTDACSANQCAYSNVDCADNNLCTNDNCDNQSGCLHLLISGCCSADSECNDGNPCTADACISNTCSNTVVANQPAYLKVVNPSSSYRKMRLGYSSAGLFSPKFNVAAGGNNQLCITLKNASGTAQWNKIKVKPQGAGSPVVYLGNYVPANPGASYFTACIPLSAFAGIDFSQISYIEIQCSNAAAFELHIQKIEFTGGATPFLWFGDLKTDNFHDGTAGNNAELITTTIAGQPCSGLKMSSREIEMEAISSHDEIYMQAYPNPFSGEVNISFRFPDTERVKLEIISMEGKQLATLFEGDNRENEIRLVKFNSGTLANGMYFYRITTASGEIYNRKLLLLK